MEHCVKSKQSSKHQMHERKKERKTTHLFYMNSFNNNKKKERTPSQPKPEQFFKPPLKNKMNFLLDWRAMGSLLGTLMFIRATIRDILPPELYEALHKLLAKFITTLKPKISIYIQEFENYYTNDVFEAVQAYLSSKSLGSVQSLKLFKYSNSKNVTFMMNDNNQKFEDTFDDVKLEWSFKSVEKVTDGGGSNRIIKMNRFFVLKFHPKYLEKVNSLYIPHVMEEARKILFKKKERKLYTNNHSNDHHGRYWSSVPFSHPSTFDTLAMDPVLKEDLKEDLKKFVNQKEFYNKVGKSWKRGYLLYGPPGTGKTSLIAAIANFLDFNIYDLELMAVNNNSDLRNLLISTKSKSVIVVEDVDCSLDLSNRKKMKKDENHHLNKQMMNMNEAVTNSGRSVSLSGVLNFVDGLWSSCGGEKLIIFTTNHKENLDAALLRPGRMDKHINLSYCGISAFKTLAKNYLDIDDEHELMNEADVILGSLKITPALVAELFMGCRENEKLGGLKNVVEEMKKLMPDVEEENIPKKRKMWWRKSMKKRMLDDETNDGIEEISIAA